VQNGNILYLGVVAFWHINPISAHSADSHYWHGLCKVEKGGGISMYHGGRFSELQVTARVIGVITNAIHGNLPATPIPDCLRRNIEGQVLLYDPYAAALGMILRVSIASG